MLAIADQYIETEGPDCGESRPELARFGELVRLGPMQGDFDCVVAGLVGEDVVRLREVVELEAMGDESPGIEPAVGAAFSEPRRRWGWYRRSTPFVGSVVRDLGPVWCANVLMPRGRRT